MVLKGAVGWVRPGRQLNTLVHIQDLLDVTGGEMFAIAHEPFVLRRVCIVCIPSRIMHDALVVVGGIA